MSAFRLAAIAAASVVALASCSSGGGGGDGNNGTPGNSNDRPAFLRGAIESKTYDGTSNDLLTAGLGKSGLAGGVPAPATLTNPTVEELRRLAIYNNYRALVDITANGGYGTLYGPNVDASGAVTTSEGKIAGEEHIVFADDGTGRQNVTLMVQIPGTFSTTNPCIITAASSGSRGVYGAIGTSGEWGLKKGCAVAYTDKGTGNGGHDLAANAVNVLLGPRFDATAAGLFSQFTANVSPANLAAYNSAFPNRWAYKHAHSQQNPEKDWGRDTLRAIEFAFYMINQKHGAVVDGVRQKTITPANTIVIASSVSNGAGAAIAAAEQDSAGLIDGVAVAEPQINLNAPANVTIRRGGTTLPASAIGRPLYDYFTLANLYQPCAAYAPSVAAAPLLALVNATAAGNRCAALAAQGLVTGGSATEQATDALNRLHNFGWEADSDLLHATHYALAVLPVTLTYANAYSKSSVTDNLCGYSFGAAPVAGVPPPLPATNAAQIFGTGNGVPPTAGLVIINNNSVGGAATDAASITPSTGRADLNIDGAICLRNLFTSPNGAAAAQVRASIEEIKVRGNLRGKPAVIVHGRSDTLVPINHTSRPYYALNKQVDAASKLAYYEVTNAQHFDGFLALGGYDTRLVPLHRYFIQAVDIVYNHLRSGTAIPPSQVVRTVPRGGTPGAAPAIGASNVPPIPATPAAADAITFSGNVLAIPE
ncbi:MAG TPA: 3-hydroxybutyrate oligomer hydrolase family protein [Usitatibacter sp.]|nr:3-hydroxybutyrate oligomer hydrolase family protein [Usitatibacter sp.]